MEKVLSICNDDPELKTLLKDHPLLLKSLESIPSLQPEHIFAILTAVENEAYMQTKDLRNSSIDRKSLADSMSLEVEELKTMLVREQDHNQLLNKVKFIQQIIKLSESLSDLAKTVQERNVSNTSKLMNFAIIERENKELKGQTAALNEQIEKLTMELHVKSESIQMERIEEKIHKASVKSKAKASNPGNKAQTKQIRKLSAMAICLIFSHVKTRAYQSVFNLWKFWIYKRTKLQEEIELKLQQSFTNRNEGLNELKASSKKYFSQLLSSISSINYQKPLEIELSSCELTKEWIELLLQSLDNNCSVTELNLGSNSLSEESGLLISNWLKQDNYLKCLILRNNDFNEMITSTIIEAVCIQNQISMLDISENIVSVESINYLIQNSNAISDLVIENCGLSGEDIKKILNIAKISSLSGLFVSYNPIAKSYMKIILEYFSNTGLKNIGLSGLPFEDADVEEICVLINKKPYLEILHLAHVEITEQGMTRILDRLCKHEDLKEVDLTGTSLHIPHVCVVIETCSSLKTIVLREIAVSQRDYSFLAETIKKSPQLEVCLLDN